MTVMVAASPQMLVQCDLAEALYCDIAQGQGCMLDDPSDFTEKKDCQPGSMSKWGPGSCVPNIRSVAGHWLGLPPGTSPTHCRGTTMWAGSPS